MTFFATSFTRSGWIPLPTSESEECKRKPSVQFEILNHHSDNWGLVLRITCSVVPRIMLPVLAVTAWATLVSTLYMSYTVTFLMKFTNSGNGATVLSNIIGISVSLLLAFKVNNSYDRFWEGRKAWSQVHSHTRNLARLIWVHHFASTQIDREKRLAAMHLLIFFSTSTKHELRGEEGGECICTRPYRRKLETVAPAVYKPNINLSIPLQITRSLQSYILEQPALIRHCTESICALVDALSTLERIRATPIPAAYTIHLKQCLLLFLVCLPFQLVHTVLAWFTIPIAFITAFVTLGVEEIGSEIEDPFGYDENDLPMDDFCDAIRDEILDIVRM